LLGSWLLFTGNVTAESQAAQQNGDQPQHPSTPKDDTKPKKTGAAPETSSKTPASSTVPTPASASASATPAAKQPRPANGSGMLSGEEGIWRLSQTRYFLLP
jgi:hypothetical protein